MRYKSAYPLNSLLAVLMAGLVFSMTSGCGSSPKNEVIFSDSFETDSTLYANAWGHSRWDTVQVVAADCPGGGSHAVQLKLHACTEDADCVTDIFRKLPEAETGDRLELSTWVRVLTPAGRGQIGFCTVSSDGVGPIWTDCSGPARVSSSQPAWTRLTTNFTNASTLYPPEISLRAYNTDSSAVTIVFDRVEVKRLAPNKARNPVSF